MATKRKTKINGISAIVAGQKAFLRLPIGPRYHKLIIEAKAAGKNFATIIEDIVLKVNGKIQREHTPAELDYLNGLNGAVYRAVDNGNSVYNRMSIYFAEPWRKDLETVDGFAWRSRGLESFVLELDIAAAAGAAVEINVYGIVDDSILRKDNKDAAVQLVAIKKVVRKNVVVNGTRQLEALTLESGDIYQVLAFMNQYINNVAIKYNGYEVHNLPKAVNEVDLTELELVPDTDTYTIVFDADDPVQSALAIGKNDVLKVDIEADDVNEDDEDDSDPRSVTVLVEKFGSPE